MQGFVLAFCREMIDLLTRYPVDSFCRIKTKQKTTPNGWTQKLYTEKSTHIVPQFLTGSQAHGKQLVVAGIKRHSKKEKNDGEKLGKWGKEETKTWRVSETETKGKWQESIIKQRETEKLKEDGVCGHWGRELFMDIELKKWDFIQVH